MPIRRMDLSDLDKVVSLYQEANLFAKKKDIYSWTQEGIEKYPNFNLVYMQNGKIIGAISAILPNRKKAILNDIVIQKKYRGNSIGSKLMRKIVEILTKEGVDKITLWIHWSNAMAIPFYYKFGFRIKNCTKTKNISGVPNGEDIIHLERSI